MYIACASRCLRKLLCSCTDGHHFSIYTVVISKRWSCSREDGFTSGVSCMSIYLMPNYTDNACSPHHLHTSLIHTPELNVPTPYVKTSKASPSPTNSSRRMRRYPYLDSPQADCSFDSKRQGDQGSHCPVSLHLTSSDTINSSMSLLC